MDGLFHGKSSIENTWMTTRGSPMVPSSYGDDIINKEILNWFSKYPSSYDIHSLPWKITMLLIGKPLFLWAMA
jgi:hypothetical protein